ncbi:DUF4179 domain-containing protein [uncultured Agathobaculum sp.]|uniref:DUF4179 domain-containing protein n=1 Tax=uncultured Agathobaculum sp. TaxID=2048140 RepID=UPI00320B65A6
MTLDEKLKARAQREGSPVPGGFDERMDALLHDLPEQVTPIKKRRAPRTAVCIGIAAALVVGAAAAAPTVLEMARNAIGYFAQNSGSEYAEYQGKYEKYNAAVGMSDTNGDQTLTIDNIAVDDSYMLVFYTLKSKTPIELVGTDEDPQSWRANWTAPTFFAEVNGKQLDTTGAIENEATMPDEYTLTGVRRIVLKEALPDQFDLLLYDGGSSDINDANFQFAMSVDKSAVAVETLTVEPKQDFTVDFSTEFDGQTYHLHYEPRIERVSISPFGSTITLSEQAEDPMTNFVLRDDKGNYLPVISNGSVGGGIGRATNSFEFLGANLDTQSVTLIPCIVPYRSHEVKGALDSLPLTDSSAGGYTLESLDIDEHRAVATFSFHGPITKSNAQLSLLLADGTTLDRLTDCFIDYTYDRENGLCITTIEYPDATPEQIAQITGVSFWQPDDDLTLLEDQAVTIDLQ